MSYQLLTWLESPRITGMEMHEGTTNTPRNEAIRSALYICTVRYVELMSCCYISFTSRVQLPRQGTHPIRFPKHSEFMCKLAALNRPFLKEVSSREKRTIHEPHVWGECGFRCGGSECGAIMQHGFKEITTPSFNANDIFLEHTSLATTTKSHHTPCRPHS
jgi:hypothetical protein